MRTRTAVIRVEEVQERILLIRGEKMIVDADLARFYGVATKRLNEQIKRNRKRFPQDVVFRLTSDERSEVVAKCDHLSALRQAIRQLTISPPVPRNLRIGFQSDEP